MDDDERNSLGQSSKSNELKFQIRSEKNQFFFFFLVS